MTLLETYRRGRAVNHAVGDQPRIEAALSSALEEAQVWHVPGWSDFRKTAGPCVVGNRLTRTTVAKMQAKVGAKIAFVR